MSRLVTSYLCRIKDNRRTIVDWGAHGTTAALSFYVGGYLFFAIGFVVGFLAGGIR